MNYRSYIVHGPWIGQHRWVGNATLRGTNDVVAESESDLRHAIDLQMDEYLKTHKPFSTVHDGQTTDE